MLFDLVFVVIVVVVVDSAAVTSLTFQQLQRVSNLILPIFLV